MKTAQEVFDTVVEHLRQQNAKSQHFYDGTILCCYRDDHGRKCAVGCLIPDSEYSIKMESYSIGELLEKRLEKDSPTYELLKTHHHLLCYLQSIHDWDEVKDWEKRFQDAAIKWNLNYTSPTK